MYSFTLFLALALDGVESQRQTLAALPPEDRPGILCTGGCVAPRAVLNKCRKSGPYGNSVPRLSST